MTQRPQLPWTLMALGGMFVAAATAVGVVLTVPANPPATLATPHPVTSVRVTQRTDADERQVTLSLETGAPRYVVTTRIGTVTSLSCTTGGLLRSGDTIATVDGAPVIGLATHMPLWRELQLKDQGDDVRGLQTELARLGARIAVDGIVGPDTIHAVRTFLTQHGIARKELPSDAVPITAFAWLPTAETTVRSC
jgi:hypothetical protein